MHLYLYNKKLWRGIVKPVFNLASLAKVRPAFHLAYPHDSCTRLPSPPQRVRSARRFASLNRSQALQALRPHPAVVPSGNHVQHPATKKEGPNLHLLPTPRAFESALEELQSHLDAQASAEGLAPPPRSQHAGGLGGVCHRGVMTR